MTKIKSLFAGKDKLHNLIKSISEVVEKTGTEAYLVGGVVRDLFLDRETKDIDITVLGDGIEFAEQLADYVGRDRVVKYEDFGTAMVPIKDFTVEVATARSEEYGDESRKPEVEKGNMEDDMLRRDFTINALAMSLNPDNMYELIDVFNGMQDLKKGLIRTPMDPVETFSEDPLRMLRAIRFATQLGFYIQDETFEAISKVKDRIEIISQERITEELKKTLMAEKKPSLGFKLMDKSGLLELILPDIANLKGVDQKGEYHHKNVFYHTMEVLDNVAENSDSFKLRFTALVHDVAKPQTKEFKEGKGWTFHGHEVLGAQMIDRICRELKLPNKVREYAKKLTQLHLRPIALASDEVTDSAIRRLLIEVEDDLDDLMLLCRSDITSNNPDKVKRYNENFDRVIEKIKAVRERDKLRKFQSPVGGDEIMDFFGLEPGPAVGYIKDNLEEAILDGEVPNEYEEVYNYMKENKDKFLKDISEKYDQDPQNG